MGNSMWLKFRQARNCVMKSLKSIGKCIFLSPLEKLICTEFYTEVFTPVSLALSHTLSPFLLGLQLLHVSPWLYSFCLPPQWLQSPKEMFSFEDWPKKMVIFQTKARCYFRFIQYASLLSCRSAPAVPAPWVFRLHKACEICPMRLNCRWHFHSSYFSSSQFSKLSNIKLQGDFCVTASPLSHANLRKKHSVQREKMGSGMKAPATSAGWPSAWLWPAQSLCWNLDPQECYDSGDSRLCHSRG